MHYKPLSERISNNMFFILFFKFSAIAAIARSTAAAAVKLQKDKSGNRSKFGL